MLGLWEQSFCMISVGLWQGASYFKNISMFDSFTLVGRKRILTRAKTRSQSADCCSSPAFLKRTTSRTPALACALFCVTNLIFIHFTVGNPKLVNVITLIVIKRHCVKPRVVLCFVTCLYNDTLMSISLWPQRYRDSFPSEPKGVSKRELP